MSENGNLEAVVKYKDLEAKFTGKPVDVCRSIIGFLSRVIPGFELISELTISIDLNELLEKVKGLIAFTPEGPVITIDKERLGGEKNAILLHLLKCYIGYRTGVLDKESSSTSDIASFTGSKSGTVAARLSELTGAGWVERVGRGEYKITTLGVKSFIDDVLPRINAGED